MSAERSFGDWLRQHRRALDLTQEELARQVGCSAITLRKLEAEERRPSKQIAERLAEVLNVPAGERADFLRFARGDPFAAPGMAPAPAEHAPSPRHNLPLQLTSFIGREQEIEEIRHLLATARLVTLTGPGGAGKTRLALQVAAGLLDDYPDGMWLVELTPLADPVLVPQTVAAKLGVREEAGRPILATLTDYLRHKTALLVVDNCEHLILACAQLAEAMLQASPDLRLLATSREALQVSGEQSFTIPPLLSPDPHHLPPLETISQYEAVRLFVDRAQAVLPGFRLTQVNASAVAQVCHQLDGIPLAIELAAARIKLLKVEQIAERLEDRFQLLTGGSRTALPRHQTLGALIDWSHDLLSEPERIVLRRLSVFAGSWTLEAAEAVCNWEQSGEPARELPDTLDLLTQLVNKSLVIAVRQPDEGTRFHLLETIRQYARAKLDASGEADQAQRRHARYYLAHTQPDVPLENLSQEILDRMDTEHENLLAALAWGQSATDSEGISLVVVSRVTGLWWSKGYLSDARKWLEDALVSRAAEQHPESLTELLNTLGNLLTITGEYRTAEVHLAHALRLTRELEDRRASAMVLERLGWLAREQGDVVTAGLQLEESLGLFRELGDQSGIVIVLNTLGQVLVMQGDSAGAKALLEESLALSRQLGDTNAFGWALNHLGHVAQIDGDFERARQLHEECLREFNQPGQHTVGVAEANQSLGETALAQDDAARARKHLQQALILFRDPLGAMYGMAWCLAGLGGVAVLNEEPERAARLWGAAEAVRQAIGSRPAPASRATRERLMAEAREQLGAEAFDAAWAEGQVMTIEQAVAEALIDG